jgi:hypothetical protein
VYTFAGIVVDWDTARSDIAVLGGVWDVGEGYTAWDGISDLEFSHITRKIGFLAVGLR